ncbi:MAG TPA: GNAT family N-acetyltransferase [Vicinamibacterales bacterium]|nr:GNAT family N-acetyltransferase [Vicinamibacterales bacterium]
MSATVLPDDVRTMEADTFSFWKEFARRPGGEIGRAGGSTWYRTGASHANYNGVLGSGTDVDEMLARVRSWGLPARWLISTASAGTIEDSFTARGLVMTDEYPAMIAPISALPAPDLNGVTVETAETASQYREWSDAICDGFGLSGESAAGVETAHEWPCRHERDRIYLLLRREGTVVATAMLHTPCGVAGIYGIAVRRAYQRQGLGRLATLVTAHAGAERGATVAMLQATKDGFPVYERLGFRTIFAFRSWQIV